MADFQSAGRSACRRDRSGRPVPCRFFLCAGLVRLGPKSFSRSHFVGGDRTNSADQARPGVRYEKILSSIAVVFKIELVFASSVFIASALAGTTISTLLARPEYAPYSYILPILGIIHALYAAYRILEVVSSAVAKQKIFFWLWPIGLVSTICIYYTVRTWACGRYCHFHYWTSLCAYGLLVAFFRRDRGADSARYLGLYNYNSECRQSSSPPLTIFVGLGETTIVGNLLIATVRILVFILMVLRREAAPSLGATVASDDGPERLERLGSPPHVCSRPTSRR